jgi:hypothetical protein
VPGRSGPAPSASSKHPGNCAAVISDNSTRSAHHSSGDAGPEGGSKSSSRTLSGAPPWPSKLNLITRSEVGAREELAAAGSEVGTRAPSRSRHSTWQGCHMSGQAYGIIRAPPPPPSSPQKSEANEARSMEDLARLKLRLPLRLGAGPARTAPSLHRHQRPQDKAH